MSAINNCLTCRWARWETTHHKKPRINLRKSGQCLYPMTRVALPLSFRLGYGNTVTAELLEQSKQWLVPTCPLENCRVWEKDKA